MDTPQQEAQQTGTGYARALTIAVAAVVIGVVVPPALREAVSYGRPARA